MYSALRQCRHACVQNGLGMDFPQRILYSLPNGRLRFRGDLLADDVVNDGRKKVRVYCAVDLPDAVYDSAKPLVFLPQIGKLSFSVCKIHVSHPPAYRSNCDMIMISEAL